MSYRVVVIGAGPGGALLARELARKGIKVALYEQGVYESLGHDWSDAVEKAPLEAAGFALPRLQEKRWTGSLVKEGNNLENGLFEPHPIPRLKIYSPDGKSAKEIEFGLITTDRRNLGKALVRQAEEAGAVIYYHHQGLELLFHGTGNQLDNVEVYGARVKNLNTGEVKEVKADVVVESSGFNSVLRRSLPKSTGLATPFSEKDFALVQREVRVRDVNKAKEDYIPDHYRYGYHSGYQWTHVHTPEKIDIGAGVRYNAGYPDPEEIIGDFIYRHPSITDRKLRGGRSLCLVGRPLTNFVASGFLVLGDAASISIPTTGCGTGSAMMAGLWASRVLEEAACENRNDLQKLWQFNCKFYLENERGSNLAALSGMRLMLQSLEHGELNFLYQRNLLDAKTLEKAINGKMETGGLLQKATAILAGYSRPAILGKLVRMVMLGKKIKTHYCHYPEEWLAKEYIKWKRRTDELFKQAESL